MYLQTRTKLQQALKGVLNCCELNVTFKCQARLSHFFSYIEHATKDTISGVVYKFQRGLCNESYYGQNISHLNVGSGEHIDWTRLDRKLEYPITVLFVIIVMIMYPV